MSSVLVLPDGRRLTSDELDSFARDLDAIRARVATELGERDATYIRRVMRLTRTCELAGRAFLFAAVFPPAMIVGVCLLGLAKILDNMEVGHNVMHGQYDFVGDPALDARSYEWDSACSSSQWRHSHNFVHHTYTNIVGRDRDVGYGIMRMSPRQKWHPIHLLQPIYTVVLALLFQWGVSLHHVEAEKLLGGTKRGDELARDLRPIARKGASIALRDYVFFPLLAGPFALYVLAGNALANVIRNVWAYAIIFCGHFTDEAQMFDEASTRDESRGAAYVRQLVGSSNLEGGPIFHVLTGNLSHQIEHHLFPDVPAHRYAELSLEVRALAVKYGLPYNTGSFTRQFATVVKRILRCALPHGPSSAVALAQR